jgi:hypothetical protein
VLQKEEQMKDKNRINRVAIISGIIASGLNNLFLGGKIIDFPLGTPEGGRIVAIGVLVITISVAAISYCIFRIEKYIKEKSHNT